MNLTYKVTAEESVKELEHSEYEIVQNEGSVKIDGLYLSRARWDSEQQSIVEASSGEHVSKLPTIEVVPSLEKNGERVYNCPVFRKSLISQSV